MKDTSDKLGNFHILPKIHKKTYSNRPIISYSKHFTNKICLLLDSILKTFTSKADSYIKDLQNFIQKTMDLKFNDNDILAVADFRSFYSNIDHIDCINKIGDFLKDKINSEHIDVAKLFFKI